MRINLPITDSEYPIDDDTLILSTTDTKGRITFINPTFIEVSGYTEEELIGKAHNIVRHPEVPSEVFEDLWRTLKTGLPWTGLIKNRRKNGDYYWVLGNATPIKENGNVTGFLSVRTKPSRELIETVSPLYQQFIDGKAHHLAIEKGQIVRTDFAGKITASLRMTTRKRLVAATCVPVLLLACVGGAGWWGLTQEAAASWLSSFIATVTVGGILFATFLSFYLARNIQQPLRDAVDFANILAAGDLKTRFTQNRDDEFGELFKALGQLGINLRTTVLDVRSCAFSVQQATSEIASGNLDLSQRTEEQAASLEETASNMKELTAMVRQNDDSSKQANQLVMTASDIAVKGGKMMCNVVNTMSSINDSSSKIAEIISVINSIAFQTNILALNAAVEAARAGEQGRGFAVVATEVRNLAQRSAAAAKDIKTLIDSSVKNVNAGTRLVDEAGKTMEEIVASIKRVTDIMSEITSASSAQSEGIEQISQAVSQMDEVTQQNAALVEQAAAAAESLEDQTRDLSGAISIFKIASCMKKTTKETVKLSAVKVKPVNKQKTAQPAPASASVKNQKIPARKIVAAGGNRDDWEEF
jgi:aerotaxis receptor